MWLVHNGTCVGDEGPSSLTVTSAGAGSVAACKRVCVRALQCSGIQWEADGVCSMVLGPKAVKGDPTAGNAASCYVRKVGGSSLEAAVEQAAAAVAARQARLIIADAEQREADKTSVENESEQEEASYPPETTSDEVPEEDTTPTNPEKVVIPLAAAADKAVTKLSPTRSAAVSAAESAGLDSRALQDLVGQIATAQAMSELQSYAVKVSMVGVKADSTEAEPEAEKAAKEEPAVRVEAELTDPPAEG